MSNNDKKDDFDVKLSTKCVKGKILDCALVTWKISNLRSKTRKADKAITSLEFVCASATWELLVYPNGLRCEKSVGKVGIFLQKKNKPSMLRYSSIKFIIRIPYKDGEITRYKIKRTFLKDDTFWGFTSVLSTHELIQKKSGYLPGGVLTINCNLTLYREHEDTLVCSIGAGNHLSGTSRPQNAEEVDVIPLIDGSTLEASYSSTLANDFEALYICPKLADVMLKVGDYQFSAHKLVLSSRSKVFEAMFKSHDMENQWHEVDLPTTDIDIAHDMVRYVYCGRVRQLDVKGALSLYAVADRYGLQELVHHCRTVTLNELSLDNICEISAFADLHHDQLLLGAVESFLSKNVKEVLKTDKWKAFAKENTSLVLNLIQSVILSD